jgi:uncharacterized protein
MAETLRASAPVAPSQRIISLDVLRGFAVLGILVMNIQSFSMIEAAYINPTAYGSLEGANRLVWMLGHLFTDTKFVTIFSILYGAGILMMSQRAESRGQSPAGLHYRRSIWLIVLGLMHGYLLWYGDILFKYGVCALLAFVFRHARPRRLLTVGIIIFSVSFFLYLFFGWSVRYWPRESYQQNLEFWEPSEETVSHEISAYQGSWLAQMGHRAHSALRHQTLVFVIRSFWRILGLMLVGMALFKWGVLTAARSRRFYLIAMVLGLCIGLPLVFYGIRENFAHDWTMPYSLFYGLLYNYWGSVFVSLAYISAVMLICKAVRTGLVAKAFAAVGRMAFTNYIVQTLICTTIFYGHGLGLFGQIERQEQILIVFAVWAFQLVGSPVWLRYFRFGPLEWLWRSLTYGHVQPMRVAR